ncbi:glycosyltransferase [Klebsiella sp. BIGb0407]|uniref:glycosyltransferase n=1 Tax=Klebsiella sp. BIGb0407 TaxID=2940603 RepID=UPI00216918DF|nr:glycosyltransferase [Klebsiella sp. BIGb0407]MCS3434139.1 glycosyltransferase involved in cell wall biosynthesis [Klebsiella sp. BIGb0407]
MNVLFIIDGLPGGGAEKVVLTLAENFIREGDNVSLFSLRDVCDYPIPTGLHYQVIKDTDKSPWRKLTELSRRARLLDKALEQAEKTGKFDLILSNLHKTDRIVARSKMLKSRPLWFCLHGVFSTSYLGHRTGFNRWLKKQKIKQVYQNRNVITVSAAVGKDLVEVCGVTPSKLRTIYNPFDLEAIRQSSEQPCDIPEQDYIIHVGRFHQAKRHDRLLQAYAQSHIKAPLLLLGQGNAEQTAKITALAKELGISDRVILKGFQANPLPWIKSARLLVSSSDSEGFGNVLVEALIVNTPVVSTRCPGGPAEILIGELARGLSDLDSASLARTMKDIYDNPPPIDQNTLQRFSIKIICEQYRENITFHN